LHISKETSTSASSTGTTLFTLTNDVGADLNQQKTFVDFTLLDDNANETPQVRIGAEVGQNGDANTQEKEGSGAFVVYTNNADTTSGDAGASLAERMRVDYQGNVGIGTDSPSHEMVLRKDQSAETELSIVNLTSNASAATNLRFRNATSGSETGNGVLLQLENGNDFKIFNQFGNNLKLGTNNTERMRIDGSGNVGIGTTSPDSKLQVEYTTTSNGSAAIAEFGTSGSGAIANSGHQVIIGGPNVSGYTGAMIYSDSTSGVGIISFADGRGANDSWRGMIQYEHSNDAMTFSTNTSERMRINSSGNVGIGTGSPGALLDVGGDADAFALIGRARVGFNSHSDYASFQHRDSASSGGYALLQHSGGTTYLNSSGNMHFRVGNADKMHLTSAGNFGIGTTSPATTLEVDGILTMEDVSIPSEGVSGHAQMFSNGGEMKVNDASGNVTTISPHNFELIPGGASEDMAFSYHSMKNTPEGKLKKVNVDMMKLARLVEELTGEKLVYIDEQ
jgi:hypothetical protein